MELKYFVIKEEVQKHRVSIEHISTDFMIIDPLMKGCPVLPNRHYCILWWCLCFMYFDTLSSWMYMFLYHLFSDFVYMIESEWWWQVLSFSKDIKVRPYSSYIMLRKKVSVVVYGKDCVGKIMTYNHYDSH